MHQSNESQRAHAFHPPPYPVVAQAIPTAGPVGGPLSAPLRSHPQPHSQSFPPHPQQHPPYDNMSFPNMQCSPSSPHAYNNSFPLPMVPPPFPLHLGPNAEIQYYHPQVYPPFHPPGFIPSFHPQGFAPFANSQPPPYNHHLPSPVQSVATSVASTGFSNISKDLSSPTTTVASTTTKKMTRKSPVIASTPLKTFSYDEDCVDVMSPVSTEFSEDGGPTNVYIKGLPNTTTDKQLKEMVTAFGAVVSSKAIIDRPSGVCKGYGFAKFATIESANACIADLKSKNYEATIAKDSFYSKLKDLADLDSTNLYVSNLPPTWNEARIIAIFPGYKISKCRLLVGHKGQSRGVAFVTFEDRNVCDEIIEKFNGLQLGEKDHHLPLQVRYADTLAQKQLKKEKQAVGQFPKRSVLLNHQQTLEKGMRMSMGNMDPSGPTPLHQKGWRTSGALPVNAPPTPPRSVISAEEDSLKSD
ncbi:hypothetical protein TWF281_008034 [Arthrobotrys megalospora]